LKGIILHGGHGTRLRPLTHTGPKQLLPIANKPMSQYCVESLRDAGVSELAIIIGGTGANKVKEFYGNGEKFNVRFTYVEQDAPRGIAHAINLCKDFVKNEKFVVFLGDNILKGSIEPYVKEFAKSDAEASILLCEVDNPTAFGIADMKDGVIKKIMEKPKNPPTNLAVIGIYLLTPTIFEIISRLKPSWRNELEITDSLQMLLEENYKITHHIVTKNWKDTGTPADIIHANRMILEDKKPYFFGETDKESTISGNVLVGKGTKIKKTQIIGPVIIGDNCVIENSRIGPNTSIENNTNMVNCDIEESIVMSDCTINCPLRIRQSIIAFNSTIVKENNDKDEKIFLLGEGTKIIF
jgi:glucose-1-phosphate thymidylyltransferase